MKYAFIIALSFISTLAFGQILITGPDCVIPGTEYQYLVSGDWEPDAVIQTCIAGGVISGTTNTCASDTSISSVTVIWDSAAGNGVITVTVGDQSANLNITITSMLDAGKIDSTSKLQYVQTDSFPVRILCAGATGGSCNPNYIYQWQQSFDYTEWTDIDNAAEQSLTFSSALTKTTYFRRMVTETVSNTTGYSDNAVVIVPVLPDSSAENAVQQNSNRTAFKLQHFNNLGETANNTQGYKGSSIPPSATLRVSETLNF